MRITELTELDDKRRHLPLLLEADPSEDMIMRYLPRGRMFLLLRDDPRQEDKTPHREPLGVAVAVDLGDGRCELKNLAVAERERGLGYGRMLVEHAVSAFEPECIEMLVGTSEAGVSFYERCGFFRSHVAAGFFANNYPEPIWENGRLCKDMIYLRRPLRPSPLLSLCCMQQKRSSLA